MLPWMLLQFIAVQFISLVGVFCTLQIATHLNFRGLHDPKSTDEELFSKVTRKFVLQTSQGYKHSVSICAAFKTRLTIGFALSFIHKSLFTGKNQLCCSQHDDRSWVIHFQEKPSCFWPSTFFLWLGTEKIDSKQIVNNKRPE